MSGPELPIPHGADLESFRIEGRTEVVAMLREIVHRRARLTLHFDGADGFFITPLLAVNPDFEELVIDRALDPRINSELASAPRLTIVTKLDNIKIQFHSSRAYDTLFEGEPAFRIRMPKSVVRLQRRATFRVAMPQARPLHCAFHRADGVEVKMRLIDLSVDGLAMWAGADDARMQAGDTLSGCRIELPEGNRIQADLRVCNVGLQETNARTPLVRVGARFVALPGATAALIQRLIHFVEYNQRTRR